jgi:hypothetical protein
MTELQLQAIVNQQGIEATGESNLDMTMVNGVSVSKWHLDSMTYGKEVSNTLKESVKKYLQQFVGSERVFPTQNSKRCASHNDRVLKQTLSFRAA